MEDRPGLFENFDATEFIELTTRQLLSRIVFLLADESLSGLPPRDYGEVLVAADILYLWYENYGLSVPVQKTLVRHWRKIYLQRFYNQNHTGEDANHRLNIIETVFDRLEAAAGADC